MAILGPVEHFNANNNAAANNVDIPMYTCPSSPLPHFRAINQNQLVNGVAMNAALANYSGISGAANGLIPGFTETRINDLPCGGIISGGGTLIPNGQLHLNQITDGTSNTMLVSEHGNFIIDNTGTKQDWRPTQPWGWFLGVKNSGIPPNFPANGADNREPGLTTILYTVDYNPPGGWANNIAGLGVGVGTGVGGGASADATGANTPLNSAHTGGVNAVFCDGTVRFVTVSTALNVLAQLATRDDGVPGASE